MDQLRGKKIVITQNALSMLAGSEIVTLELAEYLQDIGMEVVVFTWFFDDPIRTEFIKRRITVTTDGYDPILKNADYVWVHHQVMPFLILDDLQKETKHPIFIFLHMSALKDIYLEQPYICDLERQISSKSLFMAEEALALAKKLYYSFFNKYDDISIFPNPVPERYLSKCNHSGELKKILIVSNHPTKEVDEACSFLSQNGIASELLGCSGTSRLISKEIISQYDLVITVAKSVQYCLCTGTPVYIYDRFGGCGYLNSRNIKKAAFNNYSGRGFEKKTSRQIAEEIVNGYRNAYEFQLKNMEAFQDKYSIANNVELVFKRIKSRKIKLDEKYINYIKSVESMVRDAVILANILITKDKNIDSLNKELGQLRTKIKDMEDERRKQSLTIWKRIYLKVRYILFKY